MLRAIVLATIFLCLILPVRAQEPEWMERVRAAQGGGFELQPVKGKGRSVAGLVAPLASKLASIQAACPGTVVISALRHTRIAGTRVMSLHATGQAVDVRGPYRCIYAQLANWSGGYSTDAGRVRHIHISYGGREAGLRFAHGGTKHHARKRYAVAQ
jgi:hypothetical protein